MQHYLLPPGPLAFFSEESWTIGYKQGHYVGHGAGEDLGEQAYHDRLSRQLDLLDDDLRLGLYPDITTPRECLRVVRDRMLALRSRRYGHD